MTENFTSRTFSEQLHSQFRILIPGREPVVLELCEVAEKDYSPQVEHFSLMFRGPLEPVCQQQIHRLEHDRLGTFDLFLVPVGPDGEGMRYQAVFNRLRPSKK